METRTVFFKIPDIFIPLDAWYPNTNSPEIVSLRPGEGVNGLSCRNAPDASGFSLFCFFFLFKQMKLLLSCKEHVCTGCDNQENI